MIDNHPGQIRILDPNADTKFKLQDELDGGGGGFDNGSTYAIDGAETVSGDRNTGEGKGIFPNTCRGDVLVHGGLKQKPSSDSSPATATNKFGLYDAQREFEAKEILPIDKKLTGGGVQQGIAMFYRWIKASLC